MASPLRHLLSPIKLGHPTAKNRIVSTPHGAAYGERGGLTDRYIRYHEEKAKGGCGTVMMFGSSSIHPTSVNDWAEINNWDDSIIPQFQEMSTAIHRHGALCLSQISHRGRRGHSWYSGTPLWGPSDTREERHREWPHIMTKAEMPKKAMEGRLDDIRTCVGASEGCIGRLRMGKSITCVQNPMIGREAELSEIHPAQKPKRVLVIGGGVGGLEAARLAALRGHKVTLLEAAPSLGGQVMVAARAPKREDYAAIAHWLIGQVRKAGVEVRLNTPADVADVLKLNPESVIVATGSTPRVPHIPGVDLPHVTTASDILTGQVRPGARCVVVDEDGHFTAPTTADFLAGKGCRVTIITRYFMVGEDIDEGVRSDLYARLCTQGVVLTPMTVAIEMLPGVVRTKHTFSGVESTLPADTVVLAFGGKANDTLFHELTGKVPDLKLIGDANSPRRIHDALLEGTRVARAI